MTYILGLTGSIGMGKSTTAQMFRDEGLPVWDADAAVHRLYSAGGGAVAPLAVHFPDAIIDGAVNRERLAAHIANDGAALARIEALVHPLVAADRTAFVAGATSDIVVCDVPLLFETGAEGEFDSVLVVTAPAEVQRTRVLARPGLTEARFETLRARQMPDAEKRARADHVIETLTLDGARAAVRDLIAAIRGKLADA